jgi:hypothetical protein
MEWTSGVQRSERRAEVYVMDNETNQRKKSPPVVFEADGMRFWVDYRRGVGGDEGLTFDVTVAGSDDGARILRFDCFSKTPHYHVGAAGRDSVHDMIAEGIVNPVSWTMDQLKTKLPALVNAAGYADIAQRIDQTTIAGRLSQLEPEILAKL